MVKRQRSNKEKKFIPAGDRMRFSFFGAKQEMLCSFKVEFDFILGTILIKLSVDTGIQLRKMLTQD